MLLRSWMNSLRKCIVKSGSRSRNSLKRQFLSRSVDSLEPRTLLSAITVTSSLDTVDAGDGVTTFREAILEANATPGLQTIDFQIAGLGPETIILSGGVLPVVTDEVEIDGATQEITLDASPITSTTTSVLTISGQNAAASSVHDLTIANAFGAVEVLSADHVTLDRLSLPKNGVRQGYGMRVTSSSFVTVSNSTVSNRWVGVAFLNVTDSVVENNMMTGTAIIASGTSGSNSYRDNDVSGVTTGTAIGLFGTLGQNVIDGNNASSSGIGIEIRASAGNRIVNNDFSFSALSTVGQAILITGDVQVEIAGNDLSNSNRGIRFNDFHDVVITPTGASDPRTPEQMDGLDNDDVNWLPLNVDLSTVTREALQFIGVSNLTIDGLSLPKTGNRSGTGIYVQDGIGVTVHANSISNRTSGVFFKDVTYSSVNQNTLVGTGVGQSGASGHVEYVDNDFSDIATRTGISLWGTVGHNLVTENNLSGSGAAVDVRNGPGNMILDNNFSSSSLSTNTAPIVVFSQTDIQIADNDFSNSSRGVRFHDIQNVVITPVGAAVPTLAPGETWLSLDVDLSTITREALQFFDVTNVTIDGMNLSRTGSRAGTGIYVESSAGVTVRNSHVANRPSAVVFRDVTGSTVEKNMFSGTNITESGASGFNRYFDNDVTDTSSAIHLFGTEGHSVVEQNDLSFSRNGITIRGGLGNRIINNNLSNVPGHSTSNAAILLRDDIEIEIADNNFTNSYRGIRFEFLSDVVITPPGVPAPVLSPGETWLPIDVDLTGVTSEAMVLFDTVNVTIDGFDLSSNGTTRTGTGLRLWDETGTTVRGVTIANRSIGISPTGSTEVDIHCSSILNNTFGINVGTATAIVAVSESHFEGNAIALRNVFASPVAAADNYWGSPDGPANDGGSGDSYSGNVDASPALNSLPDCLRTNLPPVLAVDTTSISFEEGSTAINSGTWSDPDVEDTVTLTASVGTISRNVDGTWNWSFDTNDGPDQSQTVTVTATDVEGESTQAVFGLTVNNVAPGISNLASSNGDLANMSDSGEVSITGSFIDAGLDTHSVTVDWGDGAIEDISVDQIVDTFNGNHAYVSGGIFTVTVTVTDSDGANSIAETTSAVVKGAGLVDGTLFVIGTNGKDVIHIYESWRRDQITVHANLDIRHHRRWHRHSTSTHLHQTFPAADVDQIVVHALADNDHVHVGGCFYGGTAKDAAIFGGDGHDHLIGGRGNDYIDGGTGSDFISSRGGNDVIVDMTGNNYISAGDGDDEVTTGSGNDHIHGGSGNDRINAGDGNNWVSGGFGDDIIISGVGNDRLNGNFNNDVIVGGGGNDRINGGHGRDVLIGGSGRDRVDGGSGNDLMIGGTTANGTDGTFLDAALSAWADGDLSAALLSLGTISDDAARDVLRGGRGTDELIGGAGDKLKR